MASTILVTAADEKYHESVMDLVRSVRATGFECDIGIIDPGSPRHLPVSPGRRTA